MPRLILVSMTAAVGLAVAQQSASALDVGTESDPVFTPTYHRMPLAVDPPPPAAPQFEGSGALRSLAQRAPARIVTPALYRDLPTLRLTDAGVDAWRRQHRPWPGLAARRAEDPTPLESIAYNPEQLHAAYDLDADAGDGSGQTIVIVDAHHHPNVVADLNAFSRRFGLPHCREVAAADLASLPAAGDSCSISVLYTDGGGQATTQAPRYDAGWAQEIALDTQWAHAFAPAARIVLIEAANPGFKSMLGAIALANQLQHGILSMSFGTLETQKLHAPSYAGGLFDNRAFSYVASAGDAGNAVNWPAVVPKVISVGGTTLYYQNARISEKVWSGSGGGISRWTARPPYQRQLALAQAADDKRVTNDVALVADPHTGAYVAFSGDAKPNTPRWYVFGGTSLSAPIWAAVLTLANAERAQHQLPPLGPPHQRLYGTLGSAHAANFYNIIEGGNGSCPVCQAGPGYNAPTGLGTPRIGRLLQTLGSDKG